MFVLYTLRDMCGTVWICVAFAMSVLAVDHEWIIAHLFLICESNGSACLSCTQLHDMCGTVRFVTTPCCFDL